MHKHIYIYTYKNIIPSCSLDEVSLKSRTEHFHLATLRMAEVVPHLGLPVQGRIRRHALRESKLSPGPGRPIPILLSRIWGSPGPAWGQNLESRVL